MTHKPPVISPPKSRNFLKRPKLQYEYEILRSSSIANPRQTSVRLISCSLSVTQPRQNNGARSGELCAKPGQAAQVTQVTTPRGFHRDIDIVCQPPCTPLIRLRHGWTKQLLFSTSRLLKRRQITSPRQCAVATAHILLQVVARGKWKDVDQLLDNVQQTGRRIGSVRPNELVIGNITKRVMGLIRDEAMEDRNAEVDDSSAAPSPIKRTDSSVAPVIQSTPRLLTRQSTFVQASPHVTAQSIFSTLLSESADPSVASASPFRYSGTSTPRGGGTGLAFGGAVANLGSLRNEVIEGIEEILDEISQADDQIAALGDTYINPGDYVMVYKPSSTVEKFLARAARERTFTVLIAGVEEDETQEEGQTSKSSPGDATGGGPYAGLRKKMASHKIPVINLVGPGTMAYFPLTTKVLLDVRSITASGGVLVDAGAGLVVRAACQFNRPVYVLAGVYKLSPDDLEDPKPVLEWGNPAPHADFADGALLDGIDIRTPLIEYLGPEMISAYISNL